MKKVTIITPPEYEGIILESLGKARVTQLTKVTGSDFEDLRDPSELEVDYRSLFQKIKARYSVILGTGEIEVRRTTPSIEDLRTFANDPEGEIETIIDEATSLIEKIKEKEESQHIENNKILEELQNRIDEEKEVLVKQRSELLGSLREIDLERQKILDERVALKARLESLQALKPEEFKSCFAVGIVKNDLIPRMEEYLKRYSGTYYRTASITEDESFLFVFGSEDSRKWVEALFLVFEIKDIFDVLDSGDVLLVLDPAKRKEAIEKYRAQISEFQKEKVEPEAETGEEKTIRVQVSEAERKYEEKVAELKAQYDIKINENEEKHKEAIDDFKKEQSEQIGRIDYFTALLRMFSKKNAPVLRGKVISVIQGYTPEHLVPQLNNAITEAENQIGERLFVEVTDLGHDDHNAPVPETEFPDFLQPAWILTKLRGWPSAHEINPGWISIIVFCFQFGLMFGDIGQGLFFLVIGFYLSKKFDSGMMKYLGTLFVPMGIVAIIFGFMYDSIFLIEHAISDWLHNAHINLPFHYPIMPNPIHETTTLMKLVFSIAAIEVIFGLVLGAINQVKAGNPVGVLGEHGLGMIFYVSGFYLTAMHFISIGMNFMEALGFWAFKLVIAGLILSFLEPIIHSITSGHGVGMEAIGEGIGGLMMTFVEGLANLFSFLRIAAFAVAHTSLAIAAEALTHSLHIPGIGLILMNIIALTFEFVSSSVQSLRLLYYEFMGKFFHGEGIPFRPFRVRKQKI
jgi:V/A-type H+-transporting ATPase subunit I